eukprot:CAMPEP_0185735184 /NCGR_PEP_ID=MMETSP1171-20130828/24525_1 /TAXON_ID=374046 /ORGANISM="Helicotheca tamensis, Strain CCMP826" /LENGTH=356 /DNA_ID=CAMNT_0028405385 /DNA_START=23 /DNA_END=1090 /DNA_ORIENTATION=+
MSSSNNNDTMNLTNDTNDDNNIEDELEWEEWDGTGSFWNHCVAGSIAGVAEHTLLYPVDTVKTHIQACASCPHNPNGAASSGSSSSSSSAMANLLKNTAAASSSSGGNSSRAAYNSSMVNRHTPSPPQGMMSTMRYIMTNQATTAAALNNSTTSTTNLIGAARLWRGVQTMVLGCIPAHALYFSSYEITKAYFISTSPTHELSYYGGMAAGAAATIGHDCVMTPLDTIKQRLQLGHYNGISHACKQMIQTEGLGSLFRSFPVTVLTNVPYGMIMVSTNELFKQKWTAPGEKLDLSTCLVSASIGGMVAAAATTPLDRMKTFLQTQQLQPACEQGTCPKLVGKPKGLSEGIKFIVKN